MRAPISPGRFWAVEPGVVLVPQEHGGSLRRGGPGRPPSKVNEAIRESRNDLWACRQRLRAIIDDPKTSADDLVKATVGLLRISGIEREKPRARKRATFHVTTGEPRAPGEATAEIEPPNPTAEPESGSRGPK